MFLLYTSTFFNFSVHFTTVVEHLLFFYLCYFSCTFSYIKRQQGKFPMKLTAIHSAILLSLLPTTVCICCWFRPFWSIYCCIFTTGQLCRSRYFSIRSNSIGVKIFIKMKKLSDMAEDYYFPTAALKFKQLIHISFGLNL